MPFLSSFAWVCWIKPENKTINALFGTNYGLGLGFVTFDWTQIGLIGNPLVIPWWAQVNILVGFVLFYCLIVPLIYFTNVNLASASRKTSSLTSLDLVYQLPSYQHSNRWGPLRAGIRCFPGPAEGWSNRSGRIRSILANLRFSHTQHDLHGGIRTDDRDARSYCAMARTSLVAGYPTTSDRSS